MYFGTIRKFDPITGKGEVKPEVTGNAVRFQRDAIAWDRKIEPIIGQLLCYDLGAGVDRQPWALNLQTSKPLGQAGASAPAITEINDAR